ncbi:MAG: ExbD/TolR family protein [Candidatus Zhuqueibacterota bacterium]
MMNQGGVILRLIDVTLLLLFSFISVSEISERSFIKLPKSTQTLPTLPDKEDLLVVGITPQGTFLVEDETRVLNNFQALEEYIINKNNKNLRENIATRVRIRANWNTHMKYVVALVNLCDSLKIPKGLDVVLKEGNTL